MSTSITVEFQVNDLDANYEVLGTSDNYSFQEKLGLGSNLVLNEGEEFIKVIPLKGHYGVFDIRVFAVTDIGVRSPSLIGSVEVLPKELENTFTFSDITLNNNRYENLESSVTYAPKSPGDKLEVDCEFADKNISFSWSLTPPDGHPLEGTAASNQLLNDSFFSGFKINIKNNGRYIDLDSAGFSSASLDSLSNTFETDRENVSEILQNYRDFYLSLDSNVFGDLDLSRNVEVEIVSVDRFGREATGIVRATNPEPIVSNLTHSVRGSEASFSWSSSDVDFDSVDINVLAVPEGTELPFDTDLEASARYFQQLKQAKQYNKYAGAAYQEGEQAVYGGKVYACVESHTRTANEVPDSSDRWELIGDVVDFNYFSSVDDLNKNLTEDVTLSSSDDYNNTFSVSQLWGYEYYYTFQPYDGFGLGKVYNFTNNGLVDQSDPDSVLDPLITNIKIDNLRFREVKDDLVFNWDIVDQDGNLVDINQYKFLFGGADSPSVLGLSGSLYDVHTRQTITGITEGYNSKSLDFDENGDLIVNANLPSTKVFDQYKYTRELNNSIYGIGGFPSDYQNYNDQTTYNLGDHVLSNYNIYTSNTNNNTIAPVYSVWKESETYFAATSDKFVYKNNVYVTTTDFGADASATNGLFDETQTYDIGDIVLSPDQNVSIFSEQATYNPGDFVFYNGAIYECLDDIAVEEIVLPENTEYWIRLDIFEDIKCSYFRSTINNNSSYPFSSTSNWEKLNPENLAANGEFFDVFAPAYEFAISDWSAQAQYSAGSFVVYANDVWSGVQSSQGQTPSAGSSFWANTSNGQDLGTNYQAGDLVYSNNFIYQCTQNNPAGGPIVARTNEGDTILSSYQDTNWLPFWELNDQYSDIVFGHVGIPESGKRSVGIELGIVDKKGNIVNKLNLDADNPAPYILTEGFKVDSTSEATKVKFSFNYALGFQEKTTKVHLYRSTGDVFDITGADGLPYDKVPNIENGTNLDSTLVSITLGAEDAAFGENINQIIDEPPIPSINGVDQITGYYYKILPFDDFGSGVLYNVPDGSVDQVIVYPKRYNNPNPNVMPGRVLRSDPTTAAGAVPGKISNFSGSVAFENYFLNWNAPNADYEPGSTKLLNWTENDIDHYEVWASEDKYLKSGTTETQAINWIESQNTGYRKIQGVAYSVGEIPKEDPDPARYIYGAENIFNVPANSPSSEVVYPGETNDTRSFWIRAVDFAGNKSPFVGGDQPGVNDPISGLTLRLGAAQATNIDGFESSITNKFYNTIALNPNNPFDDIQNGWDNHALYHTGQEYNISLSSEGLTNGYIWWQTGNNYYNTGAVHPATTKETDPSFTDFNDGDFIIARVTNGNATPVFHAFANALIGTANIAEAAIISAKINDLSADKITAGQIKGHKIEITHSGGNNTDQYGSIASKDFNGINYIQPETGFVLSGDGTFAFQHGEGALAFEDEKLILYGGLRSSRALDFDFVDIDLNPQFFTYHEKQDGTFEPADDCPDTINIRTTFRNSRVEPSGVRFKMEAVSGNQRYDVFGYDDHDSNGNYNNISGFTYLTGNFNQDTERKTASATFDLTGFSGILENYSQVADSVVITAKSNKSELERSTTITRVIDGRAGDDGQNGASVNIIFKRASSKPTKPTASAGIPSGWSDSDPGGTGLLWASNGVTPVGGGNYTWGDVFQVEGQAVAELYAYQKVTAGGTAPNSGPTDGTYNFAGKSLSAITDWQANPPSITSNGDKIYVSVGLATGSATDTAASISWGAPAIYAQRTDGQNGASVNIIFKRASSKPTKPTASAGIPSGWSDSDPGGTGLLWASNGVTPVGGGNYTWGDVFQVEGQAVAELYAYQKVTAGGTAPNSGPTDGTYNFAGKSLSAITDWQANPPSITSNGDKIYVSVGLATGSATDTAASISWGAPAIYAQRTDGQNGASVNIIFKRASSKPTKPTASAGIPSGWSDSDPGGTGLLWASNGVTPVGGGNYTWGDVFQVEGQAVAELYAYQKVTAGGTAPNSGPTDGTYNFAGKSLSAITDWQANPPSITSNGDKIYVSVGLATGSATDTAASISWGTPAIYAQRTDGDPGNNGLSPTYRGQWDKDTLYINIPSTSTDPGRGDIVYYDGYMSGTTQYYGDPNTKYYICIKDIPNISSQDFPPYISTQQGVGTLNSTYWLEFGDEFDNVATNILLTEEAYITDKLIIGDYGFSGAIVSNGFTGGLLNVNTEPYQELTDATENYDTPGFLLARTDDGVVFDVGGTGIIGQTGYIRFSSETGKLEIKGSFINNTVIDENIIYTGVFELGQTDEFTSFIGGGYNNDFIQNSTEEFQNIGSSIVGGAWNEIKGRFSTIAGGYSGYCADNFSFIGGGWHNHMPLSEPGNHQGANFIGCGIYNTISGGAGQIILNGGNNIISGPTGSYEPILDFDNDLYSKYILGTGDTSLSIIGGGWTTESWIGPFWSQGAAALRGLSTNGWVYFANFKYGFVPAVNTFAYIDEPIRGIWIYFSQLGNKAGWYWVQRPDEQDMTKFDIFDPNTEGLYAYYDNDSNWAFFDRSNALNQQLAGLGSISAGSNQLNGTDTLFESQLKVGSRVNVDGEIGVVNTITSNTLLTFEQTFSSAKNNVSMQTDPNKLMGYYYSAPGWTYFS